MYNLYYIRPLPPVRKTVEIPKYHRSFSLTVFFLPSSRHIRSSPSRSPLPFSVFYLLNFSISPLRPPRFALPPPPTPTVYSTAGSSPLCSLCFLALSIIPGVTEFLRLHLVSTRTLSPLSRPPSASPSSSSSSSAPWRTPLLNPGRETRRD